MSGNDKSIGQQASEMADNAKQYVSETAESVKEKMGMYTNTG